MTDITDNNGGNNSKPIKKRTPMWKRLLKWTVGVATAVVGLLLLICTLIVWILIPGKLTPLVEKYASEYLDADVRASKIELTFWKTFPRMELEVDSLRVVSRSLAQLPDSQRISLPSDADTLLTLGRFGGGVNIVQLMAGRIDLHDVVFDRLAVNMLQVNDSVSNYNILPPSEKTDTAAFFIPEIKINSFRITNAAPLRYRSLADSTDISAYIEEVAFEGADAPLYRLRFAGSAGLPILKEYDFRELTFGLDGDLKWSPDNSTSVDIPQLKLLIDKFGLDMSMAVDFKEAPQLTRFTATVAEWPVADLLTHLPTSLSKEMKQLKTDMRISAKAELARPWFLSDTILPAVKLKLSIPDCRVTYQTLKLSKLAAELSADFDGKAINKSRFSIEKLRVVGESIDFSLKVSATNVMKDPKIDGLFNGSVNLSKIPPRLAAKLPMKLSGLVKGKSSFRFAVSDISPERFHRVMAEGSLGLHNLTADMPDKMTAYIGEGIAEFGTTDSFVHGDYKVDSLLRVSLKIDTLSAVGSGIWLEMRNFKAGVGTTNRVGSADTTEINPFGGSVSVERLKFDSQLDSMRVRLRDARIGGALSRYKGNVRSPLLNLRVFASRMMFGQALNRVSLKDTEMALTVNMRERTHRVTLQNDSAATSMLTDEEARALRRRERMKSDSVAALQAAANGNVDITLDREERSLLRKWDYKGSLKAKRGSLVTPWFPLRNRLTNIDLRFNSDSIMLTDLKYKVGESDFLINGTISNVRRALTSRRNNTLGLSLDVKSDTINVNQIVKAIFAGPAMAAQTDAAAVWGEEDDIEVDDKLANVSDTVTAGPLLIPHNIDAHFRMRAKHILYSDLELEKFRGDLLIYDGAVNLRNLSASTDIGKVSVNGLYSSADPDSLQFGFGMRVDRFRLDRLTSLIPTIDTLLPIMKDFAGIVNADIAVTTDIARNMDIDIPSLRAAIKIEGDSLVLLDPDTFKTLSKWLIFKDKKRNMIDRMTVEVVVENSTVELFPFMFDIDRYRLGVMGSNDMAMNLNYHISVLKSPIPFKFGINIKGTPDNMKIRLGGAKFKENMAVERQAIADNTRVNLVNEINNIFRGGVSKARMGKLNFSRKRGERGGGNRGAREAADSVEEKLSYIDSLKMIRAGLIENPDTLRFPREN